MNKQVVVFHTVCLPRAARGFYLRIKLIHGRKNRKTERNWFPLGIFELPDQLSPKVRTSGISVSQANIFPVFKPS